jgi:Chlorophyll A-B binding protein
MKLIAAALLAGSAAAFAPFANKASSSVLKMSYENEVGVIAPTGYFDPLNLAANIDQDTFDAYRESELKHGRVAQLCVIGYIVPEIYRFPGEIAPGIKFADIPNGGKYTGGSMLLPFAFGCFVVLFATTFSLL